MASQFCMPPPSAVPGEAEVREVGFYLDNAHVLVVATSRAATSLDTAAAIGSLGVSLPAHSDGRCRVVSGAEWSAAVAAEAPRRRTELGPGELGGSLEKQCESAAVLRQGAGRHLAEDRFVMELLLRRFLRFCGPDEIALTEAQFAALLAYHGCCLAEASGAFFATFCRAAARRAAPGGGEGGGDGDEPRLRFRDFAEGVCAADPMHRLPLEATAEYLFDFFGMAPRQRFRFDMSLLDSRWSRLRPAFLAAHRGADRFTALHELYELGGPLFRLVVEFLD